MFQTAYGSLTTGLGLQSGQTLLIRGGTSTVGLSSAALAKDRGATVLSTTRRPDRTEVLREYGTDHALVDDGELADRVRELCPDGVDAALELVGGPALPDTLRAVRPGVTVCFTGSLSGEWTIPDFSPFAVIPIAVRLTVYAGGAPDLPPAVLDHQLRSIAAGRLKPAIARVHHGLDQVPRPTPIWRPVAHRANTSSSSTDGTETDGTKARHTAKSGHSCTATVRGPGPSGPENGALDRKTRQPDAPPGASR